MIVEVCGVNFHNLGAALMLAAASREVRRWADVTGVCVNFLAATPQQRRSVHCDALVRVDAHRLRRLKRPVAAAVSLAPTSLLEATGLVKESSTDVLLDASGFLFGDQHGAAPAERRGSLYRSYRRRGKPVVLLPQAFGPFRRHDVAAATRATLEEVDLIFARDRDSLAHLRTLALVRPLIKTAPDFTNLLEPEPRRVQSPTVVVIPNTRMTAMVDHATGQAYLEFLEICVATAVNQGFRAQILVHDADDRGIAERLAAGQGSDVSLATVKDPIEAKSMISAGSMVVSSRYHGLVSAMSQGVPSVGTSWSHKYEHLFSDYGCPDALWDSRDTASASGRLGEWLASDALDDRRARLLAPAEELKGEARAMWDDVKAFVTT